MGQRTPAAAKSAPGVIEALAMRQDMVKGEAGWIECLNEPADSPHGMILCHPHPLYGGTMLDGVLESTCHVAKTLGISTVRFNFRGVGASAGEYDNGQGEINDLAAIVEAFRPNFDAFCLAGYSFGARIALDYTASNPLKGSLLLFAPPTQATFPNIENETHTVVGDQDTISSHDVLENWTRQSIARTLHVIDDADHFLAGFGRELQDVVTDVLVAALAI